MADEHAGKNVLFQRGDGASSEAFVSIAKTLDTEGLNRTLSFFDKTTRDSTAGYMEKGVTFRDPGTATVTARWSRDNWLLMIADFEEDDFRNYQFVMPDTGATTETWSGHVKDLGKAHPKDGMIESTVTFEASGQPTQAS